MYIGRLLKFFTEIIFGKKTEEINDTICELLPD